MLREKMRELDTSVPKKGSWIEQTPLFYIPGFPPSQSHPRFVDSKTLGYLREPQGAEPIFLDL